MYELSYLQTAKAHDAIAVRGPIAEWVENDETLRELGLLGIDYAQGYGVAKPHRVG